MTSTRKRIYLIVIGVGGLALVVDRLVLSDSATAPQTAEAASNGSESPAGVSAAPNKVPIPAVPFPDNLPDVPQIAGLRDVFARPDNPEKAADRGGGARPKTRDESQVVSPAEFVQRHSLEAVFREADLHVAVVNGRWLGVGDVMDACRLVGLRDPSARFACPTGEAVLDISDGIKRMRD